MASWQHEEVECKDQDPRHCNTRAAEWSWAWRDSWRLLYDHASAAPEAPLERAQALPWWEEVGGKRQ